jgi:hypothetical protein
MKKALTNKTQILEVCDAEFPVHPDLVWVDVPDDTTEKDTYVNGAVVKFAYPEIPPAPQSLTDMILGNPDELAKLKAALGLTQ